LVNINVAQGQGCCGGNPNARQQCIIAEVDHIAATEMNSVADGRRRAFATLGGARPNGGALAAVAILGGGMSVAGGS